MRPAFEAWRDKHREGIQQLAAEFWRLVERDAGSSEEFARRKAVLLEDERLQNIAEANTIATFRETRARILCDGEMSDLATLSDAVLKRALADVSGRLKDPPAPATRGSSR